MLADTYVSKLLTQAYGRRLGTLIVMFGLSLIKDFGYIIAPTELDLVRIDEMMDVGCGRLEKRVRDSG